MPTEAKKEYLHLFQTQAQHDAAHTRSNENYIEPWVAYTIATGEVSFNLPIHDYSQDYLTFEALENGTFTLTIDKDNYGQTLDITSVSYSLDDGETWTTTQRVSDGTTTITTPSVTAGSNVLWKGIATKYYESSGPGMFSRFSSTGNFNVSGNIASLCYGDNFRNVTTGNVYGGLWQNCTKVISARYLILPAMTLANYCYNSMFQGCTALTTAPTLPATTAAIYCYGSMFYGCTSLATAPALPAETLANSCYANMFQSCTSLTATPDLPATTVEGNCYGNMFCDCTSLTAAPTTLPATTLANSCYGKMFYGCTSLTTAPILPATTLVQNCYAQMFCRCSSLNYIKAMFTTTPSYQFTNVWVSGVAANGTFVKNSAAQWDVTGTNGVPDGWTVETASE